MNIIPTQGVQVVVVDDHKLIIEGCKLLLSNNKEVNLIGSYVNPKDFLEALKNKIIKPQIVLIDLNMPEINGVQLTKTLQSDFKNIRIIVLSMIDDVRMVQRMLKYGASGYLLKNEMQDELSIAIKEVSKGNLYYNKNIRSKLFRSNNKNKELKKSGIRPKLSNREEEVLQLILNEKQLTAISEILFISKETVISHRKNIMQKFGVNNTAGLVKSAIQWGYDD